MADEAMENPSDAANVDPGYNHFLAHAHGLQVIQNWINAPIDAERKRVLADALYQGRADLLATQPGNALDCLITLFFALEAASAIADLPESALTKDRIQHLTTEIKNGITQAHNFLAPHAGFAWEELGLTLEGATWN
ncbi:hypothetical protein [Taklimakanibacter albus]|uniref:Uncharacterized protein n=1 Tax=Taklimakanibacter albus TaxID=2800327 RepID=A0ACC5R136_9HYPH|nr:hypothetical protein [Aestuariivirga sp. YIM B02566]MBK1866381.1 hypothetical protein [Aestuariivirga sp. YIM B02566]